MATESAAAGTGTAPSEAARSAAHSATLRRLAQLGLLGYGLLHVLIAWLTLQLAWDGMSDGGRSADSSGALALLARSAVGDVLLWVVAVGLAGLCVWQAVEVLRHHRHLPPSGEERRSALLQVVKTVGTAVFYGYLAYSAVRTAVGHEQDRGKEQHTVRGVLGWPAGQVIVVGVAVVTAAVGVYLVRKGLRSDFLEEVDLRTVARPLRSFAHRAGQVGFVLKGVALALSGAVIAWAAISFDPRRADGLDGALRAIATAPYGRWLLTVIAAGLASFAVYCATRARHPVG